MSFNQFVLSTASKKTGYGKIPDCFIAGDTLDSELWLVCSCGNRFILWVSLS